MSTAIYIPSHEGAAQRARWPIDGERGVYGMYATIATEAALFVCLFASYYFLGNNQNRWATDQPPKLQFALIMLAVLLLSSFVLAWGEKQVAAARFEAGRAALWATVALGVVFLTLTYFEYRAHLRTLKPTSDAYGSIFYTITSFHAAHVIVGLLMLSYAGILRSYGPSLAYRPYRVVALYWHFVDIVWIFVVLLLYIGPNLQAHT